jgi:2-keto-4-pentenoate hydratase/2-oxohepta-3-ene-1,7-dioic acid hydratase in catechol pathway
MRLGTIQTADGSRLVGAAVKEDATRFVDLSRIDGTLPRRLRDLLGEADGLERAAAALQRGMAQGAFAAGRLLAPIPDPGKVICIGLNYRDHAAESGASIPAEPVVFSKFSSAVIGPEEPIRLPAVAKQVDYEAELVVIIGQRGRNIAERDALGHVAGYTCGHDVSARDWQIGRPGGQWLLGKTPDTFAPIGPYLVTADEIGDPHSLGIRLRLNGETMQNSNTREFIFRIERLIAHVSQLVTLEPGDLIFTGTPPGVGMARKPPVFLKPGDVVEVEIEGIGVLRNPVEAA